MAEYIEKKAVMGAIDRLESENNCGTSDFIESKRIAYKQVTEAINSLPTQEDKSDTHLLDMLLEAINYVYKQLNGKYGSLSYVVSDKVKYIERVRAEKIEQKKHEEFEARERGGADLEAEIRKYMESDDTNPVEPWDWRDKKDCARHFAEWGAEHLKK